MKTVHLLAGSLSLAILTAASASPAGTPATTLHLMLGAACLGQQDTSTYNDLLQQARKAIDEGRLETAEAFLVRAEKLEPQGGMLRIGDSTKKVRQELERKRTAAAHPGGTAGGGLFSAFTGRDGGRDASADPFAARGLNDPTPPTGAPAPAATAAAAASPQRAQCDALLLEARRALADNDVPRAQALVDQAQRMGVRYEPFADGPAKVAAAVAKHQAAQAAPPGSEAHHRARGESLVEQAEALLQRKQFDLADRLARDAQQLPVEYKVFENTPDKVLQRIADARRSAGNSTAVSPSALTIRPAAPSGSIPGETAPTAPHEARLAEAPRPDHLPAPNLPPPHPIQARPTSAAAAPPGQVASQAKQQAAALVAQARRALHDGNLAAAEQLAQQAEGLAPDAAFGPIEDRPALVVLDVQRARLAQAAQVAAAAGAPSAPVAAPGAPLQAVYDPSTDATHNLPATGELFAPLAPPILAQAPRGAAPPQPMPAPGSTQAAQLYRQGEQALSEGKPDLALRHFEQAYQLRDQLDPSTRQRLQDHLQLLSAPAAPARLPGPPAPGVGGAQQEAVTRQILAEVSRQQMAAREMTEREPRRALELLQQTRQMVASSQQLDPASRDQLLRRVDLSIGQVEQFIQANRAQIELDERNRAIRQEVDAARDRKVQVGEQLAVMVDQFNKLLEERRFAEAEIIAKKANEMEPENPVTIQMVTVGRTLRHLTTAQAISDEAAQNFLFEMEDIERGKIPFVGNIQFPQDWAQLTRTRRELEADGQRLRTPRDLQIEQRLSTPVSLRFEERPLGEVLGYLAKVADVNLYLDPQGLAAEGVTSDSPVTINLSQDISLKSALKLILEPLRLTYVIKDEVLRVTSESMRSGQLYTKVYRVADLIIPIPNFAPDGREGISGALREGHARLGYAGSSGGWGATAPMPVMASTTGSQAMINPTTLAQMQQVGAAPMTGVSQPMGFGPGGLGGGSQADFDSLIELITTTIEPPSWDAVGGPGSIAPFETNLSVVVSQTQEVHEEIADLLSQLRRLQDLQVTIEVRFITLRDNFFERIGVDFDFNIDTDVQSVNVGQTNSPSKVVGLDPTGAFTPNFDIQFRQGGFNAAVPPFGGFDAMTAGTFGFAILSDLEAFFLIQAAQGDTRTNVLQAPKVTLFNGQQAFVSDTSQRPFVTSVIPVVGDFAAAQQPVIVVLSEGTSLTVQAVVSNDRRFVRLTVVPFFSQIGDVEEFTFQGATRTETEKSDEKNGADDSTAESEKKIEVVEGTTVQLPTFSFVTVTTTVSVPDGGTVLLGGIKRLSEGRNERGIPILSKLPYINRLFKNVGIGRETSSLMLMVTPRIIIQEEEEAKLGLVAP